MSQSKQEKNKALVLEAFDTLFNKRDYVAAERYWSPHYIQHSAHIAPGRDGLFNLIKSVPPTLKYEPGTIVAEGDFVIVHGRLLAAAALCRVGRRFRKRYFAESLRYPAEPHEPSVLSPRPGGSRSQVIDHASELASSELSNNGE